MNWNEIKVHLAPLGSEVHLKREASVDGAENSSTNVVTISLPLTVEPRPVRPKDIELWFMENGFGATSIKLQSSQYEWEDVSATVLINHGLLASVALHFRAGPDLCERALIWDGIVRQLCEKNRLNVINPATGLVPASQFLKLIERSFAWGYFTEMEKWRKFA